MVMTVLETFNSSYVLLINKQLETRNAEAIFKPPYTFARYTEMLSIIKKIQV